MSLLCSCVPGSGGPGLFVSEVIVSHMGPGTHRVLNEPGVEESSLMCLSQDITEAGTGACMFMG